MLYVPPVSTTIATSLPSIDVVTVGRPKDARVMLSNATSRRAQVGAAPSAIALQGTRSAATNAADKTSRMTTHLRQPRAIVGCRGRHHKLDRGVYCRRRAI